MNALEQQLLDVNVVLIAAGAWFLLWVLRKIWKGMDKIKWVARFKPLYPALLCQGFVWIPGALPAEPEPTIGSRILIGLWCGFLASIGYQVLKRILGRQGIDLPEKADDLLPVPSSEDDKQDDNTDDDEPEASESRDTPVETPIPRKAKDEGEAGDSEGADDGEKDGDAA